jgi:hypothetical protein
VATSLVIGPNYQPVYTPGKRLTLTTSGPVLAGSLVEISGNGTVQQVATDASLKVVGAAAFDAPANAVLEVHGFWPVHESVADGTVTAGDQVVASAAANRVIRSRLEGDPDLAVLGVAVNGAPDGTLARWMQT